MPSYTKLFASIITSSLWTEDDQTRIMWITMLAMADKHGEIHASLPGLARIAGVSIESAEIAIAKFLSPDKYSRTPDNDGRRIEAIDGGWWILNHQKYRQMASREDEKERSAERVKRHRKNLDQGNSADKNPAEREESQNVTVCNGDLTPCNGDETVPLHIADTYTDTESNSTSVVASTPICKKTLTADRPTDQPDTFEPELEWMQTLQHQFPDRDVDGELTTFREFCRRKGSSANRNGFFGWLKKASPAITGPPKRQPSKWAKMIDEGAEGD